MKFKTGGYPDIICEGGLIGHIDVSFEDLVKAFGKPGYVSRKYYDPELSDGKVRFEWTIEYADATTVRIYDWKNYERTNEWIKDNERDWHVGGSILGGFSLVRDTLEGVTA